MSKIDYEKHNRQRRVDYRPRLGAQSATQAQLDYIVGLSYKKGQSKPKPPKTKRGAGNLIDQLLTLPDVNPFPRLIPSINFEPSNQARVELLTELKARFPKLTPMSVNSLIQLFTTIDEFGCYLFFEELSSEGAPEPLEELVPWILRAFLDWLT